MYALVWKPKAVKKYIYQDIIQIEEQATITMNVIDVISKT